MEFWSYDEGLCPFRRSRRIKSRAHLTEDWHVKSALDNANPQSRSPFFSRLPAEIRGIIYSFVAPSQVIHIKASSHGVTASSCYCTQGGVCYITGSDLHLGLLGLATACRLTYAESIPVYYRQICFLFHRLQCWKSFCDNLLKFQTSAVGALQSLRSVQIDFRARATFTRKDEATLRASLETLMQQAPSLEKMYLHLAPRYSAFLRPMTLDLFSALSKVRGLKDFDFSVQHPLAGISMDRLSLYSAKHRKEFEEQVDDIRKTLNDWVHRPRGVETAETDGAVRREFARIMAAARPPT